MKGMHKHNEKWYQRRLAKYFEEKYGSYEDVAEFFADPDINVWLFYIPNYENGYNLKVKLTCGEDGCVYDEFSTYKS